MRKKTSSKSKSETSMENEVISRKPWNPEGQTLLSAMQFLTPKAEDRYTDHILITDAPEVYSWLERRLGMNHMQTMVLVAGVYHSFVHCKFDVGDISNMIGLHPLEVGQVRLILDELIEMGYLSHVFNHMGDDSWILQKKAMKALQEDRPFNVEDLRLETNMDFLNEISNIIHSGMRYDSDDNIAYGAKQLMAINPHLPVVRNIDRLSPDKTSTMALLAFMATIAVDGYGYGDMSDLSAVLTSQRAKSISRAFKQNTHPFVQQGIIEPYSDDGMAQSDRWSISLAGWRTLLENEQEVEMITEASNQAAPLISCKQLKKKELFFSGKTAEQTQRLQRLLDDEQYPQIREALRKKEMPIGFSCLFYGAPGTGKTELVQQIAIETGRDIMQVNLAALRDKFVGETEKRVRSIFDSYRILVQRKPKTPILFFNEADAIFGNRMENTQHSVDKMENAVQNIILQEMERLEGIMICTTNLTSTLDKAFDRRFLFKIEFERPSNEARKKIWQSKLKGLTDEQAETLASRYDFSGGQIDNITRKQIIHSILTDSDQLDFEQIIRDCGEEKMSRSNGKKIGFA